MNDELLSTVVIKKSSNDFFSAAKIRALLDGLKSINALLIWVLASICWAFGALLVLAATEAGLGSGLVVFLFTSVIWSKVSRTFYSDITDEILNSVKGIWGN